MHFNTHLDQFQLKFVIQIFKQGKASTREPMTMLTTIHISADPKRFYLVHSGNFLIAIVTISSTSLIRTCFINVTLICPWHAKCESHFWNTKMRKKQHFTQRWSSGNYHDTLRDPLFKNTFTINDLVQMRDPLFSSLRRAWSIVIRRRNFIWQLGTLVTARGGSGETISFLHPFRWSCIKNKLQREIFFTIFPSETLRYIPRRGMKNVY